MNEAIDKAGGFPNVAVEAGRDPEEVMREYGVEPRGLRTAAYEYEQRIAELEAELAAERATVAQPQERTCRIVAHVTDGLMSESPRRLFELSCGHSVMLFGLTDEPAFCAICGAVVVKPAGEHDTREEIEADIDCYRDEESPDCLRVPIYRVHSWLNRQAAITDREIAERREEYGKLPCGGTDCMELVNELQAERDKLEHDCELLFDEKRKLEDDLAEANSACNTLRASVAGLKGTVERQRDELAEARHAALGVWRALDRLFLSDGAVTKALVDEWRRKLAESGIEAS